MTSHEMRRFARQLRAAPTFYKIGQKVTCSGPFTSTIGVHFRAGSVFTVEIGGETAGRSIALRSDGPDASRVWISDGLFLTWDSR